MLVATEATLGDYLALTLPDSLSICTHISILLVGVDAAVLATRLNRRLHLKVETALLLHLLLLLMLSVQVHALLAIASYGTIVQGNHSRATVDLAMRVDKLGVQAGRRI